MRIQKGDRFLANYSKQTYQIAGKWGGNWVLAPVNQDNDECLIYMGEEIEELVNRRQWLREAECEMRRRKLKDATVSDCFHRGKSGGTDIPAFDELQMTEGEELGLGRSRRENFQGENGMRADDCEMGTGRWKAGCER